MEFKLLFGEIDVDIAYGLLVSIITLVILLIFYLYKKENRYVFMVLNWFNKPPKIKVKKNTRTQDWFIFVLMLTIVVFLNFKLIMFMVVISDSMVPEFKRGDMIMTQTIFAQPEVGDIITFNAKDNTVAISHRVIDIKGDVIITQGDNIGIPDNYRTTQKDVIAKAIQFNGHPLVVKDLGALFITDYSKEGVIYKWGDRFTFLQQLSATIKAWGFMITILAIISYLMLMVGETNHVRK